MTLHQSTPTFSVRPNIGCFLSEEAALAALVDRLVVALDPCAIWLFGSRARGNHRPDSDYDLLVVAKPHQAWANDYETTYHATAGTGLGCDIVPIAKADFDEAVSLHTSFVAMVCEEGRLLYEANE
jgi:hypothetical protein